MNTTVASSAEKTFVLRMKNDKLITVSEHIVRESKVLSEASGFLSINETEIPVSDLTLESFERCIKVLDFFKNEPPYERPASYLVDTRPPKDSPAIEYLQELSVKEFNDIVETANYLNATRLIDYIVYTYIKSNTPKTNSWNSFVYRW